jgi:hypothetical protein
VIRALIRGDHAERHIVDTGPLDHTRRTPRNGVGIEHQRDYHRWIVRGPAVSVAAVGGLERGQNPSPPRVDYKPRKQTTQDAPPAANLAGSAGATTLLTITPNEVLGHNRIVLNHPGRHDRLSNSHVEKRGLAEGAGLRALQQVRSPSTPDSVQFLRPSGRIAYDLYPASRIRRISLVC